MSALPATAVLPSLAALEARFEPMAAAQLDAVVAIEQRAYSHPWSRGNFLDTLSAGHQAQCLWAGDTLIGYFVAMPGYQEVHLLNITVSPEFQRQGWALVMLDALALWARGHQAEWVWLEVRLSNTRAQQVYLRRGFVRVGQRKRYYPAAHGEREDAVVMSLRVAAP
ncbi:ribosomal-protein-alanine N-acetyltransferase [Ottowia sp. GY511]|uniref:[Ribosomal protein bS18]-alanine N-acetyltransferase n=1 Tax=Ottowia flava TaxID=2675430 RepID=A0ABW4KQL2_9BURK|nr:ribosomal protein S18-alanine N-acetyltransferase [Ottowia sp. GY511]TXK33099.1 ribosomal-protein-alanine N-acetyltransferase [Ottowia sp. GY511]